MCLGEGSADVGCILNLNFLLKCDHDCAQEVCNRVHRPFSYTFPAAFHSPRFIQFPYMFACTSSRAYVCLRCQHRAIRRDLKWLQTDQTPGTHKRWQSAVARVRQDEDEDDFDGYVNPTTISEEPRTGTRFRHWRPSPTAKLGVDALGRPAEVLVLPNRRRKDQQADIEDEEDVSNKEERPRSKQPRILESITQETKPVSNDEAMANIEILKQEVGQVGGELRLRQWTKTREALSQGFTVRQLSNYYNVSANDSDKVQIGAHSRVELADKIISAVWKYTRKTQDKEAQVTKVFSNNYVKLFVVNQDLLKQQRTVLPGVKISKPQKSKRLEISGSVEAVNKTVEQLRRIENKVKQTTIPFPLEMKLALHDLMLSNGSRRSRPEDCMALRELLIESRIVLEAFTKGDILKIYALDDATLGSFLQNLMRWIESTKRVFVTAPTSAHVLDDNCVVPVYSNGPYARFCWVSSTQKATFLTAIVESEFMDIEISRSGICGSTDLYSRRKVDMDSSCSVVT